MAWPKDIRHIVTNLNDAKLWVFIERLDSGQAEEVENSCIGFAESMIWRVIINEELTK